MDAAIKRAKQKMKKFHLGCLNLSPLKLSLFAFADDVVVLADNDKELIFNIRVMQEELSKLGKLERLGIRGHTIDWFQNYLTGRSQVTMISDVCSTTSAVNSGVPQGSILGPILFLVYINDLPHYIDNARVYADDTTILINSNDRDYIEEIVGKSNHLVALNRLSINCNKTYLMEFHNKLMVNKAGNNDINGISYEESVSFLGVRLTGDLSWDSHINALLGKLNSACFQIIVALKWSVVLIRPK
ncbi:hypothetical protein O3M35_008846 [Rhynocoris fuscipes]|uniref:Reverse transcriptase domain-containing protein n=1 Tax=Rhynocoris fuscipes TaxID=488301 RepID=A0AAW1D7Q5_9HEMI